MAFIGTMAFIETMVFIGTMLELIVISVPSIIIQ